MRRKETVTKALAQVGIMLLGTLILAFTYYHINFENHLSEGGFVGLALLGKYAFGLSPAYSVFLLDIPVILIAWLLKGRKFMLFTLLGAVSFSLFYSGFEKYSTLVLDLHGNLFAAALLSGLLTGLGAGIVLRFGGATGGDDVLSKLISEWTGWKIGNVFFVSDAFVLLASLFFLPVKETMYTILAVWLAGKVITWTMTVQIRIPARHNEPAAVSVKQPIQNSKSVPAVTSLRH
ncbi:YitT family protein [Paenibacillus sp. JX-17]|uniref:YitT family protein n=1 Tax=Paenibacillus lacisoli TaxID=3064525 RepID=A0ABT9CB46_9BACL|nr:YitT family protein [Paenibacillus sp. JX-17]MDO7905217.1 YitT family protein [Paenibacillus sp. JX-17]